MKDNWLYNSVNLKFFKGDFCDYKILKNNTLYNFTCELFTLPWFTLNVTVVVTVKLFWFWLMPGLAHLGGGGGGVLTFCLAPWPSATIFLLSGNSGDAVHDRLFWWKLETGANFPKFLVNSIAVNFGVSKPFFRASKLLISWTGLRTLFSTLWITGEGHRTLCTRFGEISLWESLSPGDEVRSLLVSFRGSLKVVKFRVFGGVGRGWRGNDEANVEVFALTVFVGDGVSIYESKFW